MKKALLLYLSCLACYCQAQDASSLRKPKNYPSAFSRGSWLVGLQSGYSSGNILGHHLTAQAYGGYFVADKLMLGLGSTWSQEGTEPYFKVLTLTLGPMARFQFTRTRLSPFLAASYQIGQRTLTEMFSSTSGGLANVNSSQIAHSTLVSAGLSIGIVPALRIDLAMNWQENASFGEGLFQPQLGINYQFASRN